VVVGVVGVVGVGVGTVVEGICDEDGKGDEDSINGSEDSFKY
jgi:hypothetical protein